MEEGFWGSFRTNEDGLWDSFSVHRELIQNFFQMLRKMLLDSDWLYWQTILGPGCRESEGGWLRRQAVLGRIWSWVRADVRTPRERLESKRMGLQQPKWRRTITRFGFRAEGGSDSRGRCPFWFNFIQTPFFVTQFLVKTVQKSPKNFFYA